MISNRSANEAATSRGRRNSVAASSRGVGEKAARELAVSSTDIVRYSETDQPAGAGTRQILNSGQLMLRLLPAAIALGSCTNSWSWLEQICGSLRSGSAARK